jgi:hypothetical protein
MGQGFIVSARLKAVETPSALAISSISAAAGSIVFAFPLTGPTARGALVPRSPIVLSLFIAVRIHGREGTNVMLVQSKMRLVGQCRRDSALTER